MKQKNPITLEHINHLATLLDQHGEQGGSHLQEIYENGILSEVFRAHSLGTLTAETRKQVQEVFANASARELPASVEAATVKPLTLSPIHTFRFKSDGADASTLIGRLRPTFFVSGFAEKMTQTDPFKIGPAGEGTVGVFTSEQLGVTGWRETDSFGSKGTEHVKKLGLLPVCFDDAFYVRAEHKDQQLGEWIRFLHSPIRVGGYSRVFFVGRDRGSGRYVHGCNLRSGYGLGAGGLVACRFASALALAPLTP